MTNNSYYVHGGSKTEKILDLLCKKYGNSYSICGEMEDNDTGKIYVHCSDGTGKDKVYWSLTIKDNSVAWADIRLLIETVNSEGKRFRIVGRPSRYFGGMKKYTIIFGDIWKLEDGTPVPMYVDEYAESHVTGFEDDDASGTGIDWIRKHLGFYYYKEKMNDRTWEDEDYDEVYYDDEVCYDEDED